MTSTESLFNTNLPPLAERIRPKTLAEFIGQNHLVDDGKILSLLSANKLTFSLILWGPPGTGKTTLARIIARSTQSKLYELSAVSSGVKELREIIQFGKKNGELGLETILFIDEIHRFSKSQQDTLLHAVENGSITLLGATTENPSFEVISPLLSRCRVLVLKSLNKNSLSKVLSRAISMDVKLRDGRFLISDSVKHRLIVSSGGDARKMLNTLDIAMKLTGNQGEISEKILTEALQAKTQLYDKKGDYHYDTISAYIKSVRGSDPDAAIYWLAVMLEGGENPEFIARRLIILASEDIGNADPQGITVAVSGFQAVHMIGMPEAAIVLSQITVYLASAPKSNSSYMAINKATDIVKQGEAPGVPIHLRNAPTKFMKQQNYGKGYRYPHDHPGHFVSADYLPDSIKPDFYRPTNNGHEAYIKERLASLWPDRFK